MQLHILTHHHVILAMPACADLPAVCHRLFSQKWGRAESTFRLAS